MFNKFTAIVERDGPWYIANAPKCPEPIPRAIHREPDEAIALILECR
jgi:hypothetical protein